MLRGVSFQIPQGYSDSLNQILRNIDVEKYHWYNDTSQAETWNPNSEDDFFVMDEYNGPEFKELIRQSYLILFLRLLAFQVPDEFTHISSYSDFLSSACCMIILIYDCENVEIYSKDIQEIEILYNSALENGYTGVEYITDSNDGRTSMNIR